MNESLIGSDARFDFDPDLGKVTVRDTDHFPSGIFEIADQIRILDMTGISVPLPADFAKLTNLQVFFNSFNKNAGELPEVLGECEKLEFMGMRSCGIKRVPENSLPPSLKGLTLTDNLITTLPTSIGRCTDLRHLMMTGNQAPIPKELENCMNLEKVRWSANGLSITPEWFLHMPRLAWYVDSGNPSSMQADTSGARLFAWNEVALGDELGRSAKNVTYRAKLNGGQEVAIKLYGHEISTDGRPEDALGATLLLGEHPNIVGGIGKLVNVPDGKQGLVMPLIPPEFSTLAGLPNLSTVTRDVYEEGRTFNLSFVQNVLCSVSSAMVHMHGKGVMNGDLYGHNIMARADGVSLVLDFEAATVYKPRTSVGGLRERVDVRSYGILMEELLDRCQSTAEDRSVIAKLQQVKSDCLVENVTERPSFAEIADSLGQAA